MKCGLHRVQLVADRQSLNRRHTTRADLDRQHHAGADGNVVQPNRTGGIREQTNGGKALDPDVRCVQDLAFPAL